MSKVLPNILPPPLKGLVNETERNMRLKAKRKQETGKRGPMKAVVPVDSMTRAGGPEKKGEDFLPVCIFAQNGLEILGSSVRLG